MSKFCIGELRSSENRAFGSRAANSIGQISKTQTYVWNLKLQFKTEVQFCSPGLYFFLRRCHSANLIWNDWTLPKLAVGHKIGKQICDGSKNKLKLAVLSTSNPWVDEILRNSFLYLLMFVPIWIDGQCLHCGALLTCQDKDNHQQTFSGTQASTNEIRWKITKKTCQT